MIPRLALRDFTAFFVQIHGYPPFKWQARLLRQVAKTGNWPDVLELPSGFGKTAVLDIAVFHLALEASRKRTRRAPVRIAFVVDRRLVVDDSFVHAGRIAQALIEKPPSSAAGRVAARLQLLAGAHALPLVACHLRGGLPYEGDWASTPSQPTILCSTVDQIGSRLLFRGYGVSNSMKPVHAGLIGTDCLILLDETHLSEPFRQTLQWVKQYKSSSWRESKDPIAPWGATSLTDMPGSKGKRRFILEKNDFTDHALRRRWRAQKPARLLDLSKFAATSRKKPINEEEEETHRITAIKVKAREALRILRERGIDHPAVAVVVNHVARAQEVFKQLRRETGVDSPAYILLTGTSRPAARETFLESMIEPIRTGHRERALEKPLVIVATQCIEAGVDIDLDGLVTEAAPIDVLRQRFGSLNRDGRSITPYAVIIGGGASKDLVYGEATMNTWKHLIDGGRQSIGRGVREPTVDFGLARMNRFLAKHRVGKRPEALFSRAEDAPVLLPAHLDLLCQTSPVPSADPEVGLYLHGSNYSSDSVSLVWRADIDPQFEREDSTFRILQLAPPRTAEAVVLPAWTVRTWLGRRRIAALPDIPSRRAEEKRITQIDGRKWLAYRWTGQPGSSAWIDPEEIEDGATIVVPAAYGGIEVQDGEELGWNPGARHNVRELGHKAASRNAGRRLVVRVAPGLLNETSTGEHLAEAIAQAGYRDWRHLRDAVAGLVLPDVSEALRRLKGKVEVYSDLYGEDEYGRSRGVLFVAARAIGNGGSPDRAFPSSTEDDWAGSLPGFSELLETHSSDVERMASEFATMGGLSPDRIKDISLAAYLHDAGKADSRFQSWLADDPLGPDPGCAAVILGKSARRLPRSARMRPGLPQNWRHEAMSVRLALFSSRFPREANDPELVLWLVGTHHGYGRPLFPHDDPADAKVLCDLPSLLGIPRILLPFPGPQSLAFDWNGLDWPRIYERLKARYGVWELAYMETILRLADHRASNPIESRANRQRNASNA